MFSQDFTLELSSKQNLKNSFLSKINFKKQHTDTVSIFNELHRVHNLIKSNGYFLSSIDSLLLNEKKYTAYFDLNKKLDSVILKHNNLPAVISRKYKFHQKKLKIPISGLQHLLTEISAEFENKGVSFSKIKLQNFKIINKTLYTDLFFTSTKERKISKVIIKGYANFPNSFIKNFFNINIKTIYNKKKLKEISKLSQSLDFAAEIKPPETLFTKDSTYVYMYLKKNNGSSFDGLINFSSQENGKLQFNGYLNLQLKNILNTGESLHLLWNSFGSERQEFSVSSKTPYIFNSKLTPELSFSIYKQDSTFLNTKFNSNLAYQIKNNAAFFLSYTSENSENLISETATAIKTYNSSFLGFGYHYQILKNDIFKNDAFSLNLTPSFGKRKSNDITIHQIKLETTISYLLTLNERSSIYLKNNTGILNSENYLKNELFRIGGKNSIRGFNEQSIFVEDYILQNIEYRYLTSKDSYIYSITDIALTSASNNTQKLLGLGFGYLFNTKNAQINISLTNGISDIAKINLNSTQFFVNWINFF